MNILIENSGYHLRNMGDLAMLQAAVERLMSLFPTAKLTILTADPDRLTQWFPEAIALPLEGRDVWTWPLVHALSKTAVQIGGLRWSDLETGFGRRLPRWRNRLLQIKLRRFPKQLAAVNQFWQAMVQADLVVATGGGYVTDAFMEVTNRRLDTLALAVSLGKPTVMMGQGLGPLQHPANYAKAQQVLPLLDRIALREQRQGIPLLKAMQVSSERIQVTGDDAIELAFRHRQPNLGYGIGVNLRVAQYSDVTSDHIAIVRDVLHQFAYTQSVPLLPVPIDHFAKLPTHPDSESIQKLLAGHDDASDGGASLDTPLKIIEQIGRCRVVVTGSYHAGVFALSQGIPVIGLAKSQYYIDKFLGLADQFAVGCETVLLTDPDLRTTLEGHLYRLWQQADELRSPLLLAAQAQIERGHAAYQQLKVLYQGMRQGSGRV